nr:MAG TPA: hypothetical protein [Caudoviricetes sp.]
MSIIKSIRKQAYFIHIRSSHYKNDVYVIS